MAFLNPLFLSGRWAEPPTTPGLLRSRWGGVGWGLLTIHCQKTSSRRLHRRAASRRLFSVSRLPSSCSQGVRPHRHRGP